jgi:hypothetical protein
MFSSRHAWRSARARLHSIASLALLAACTACHVDPASAAATFTDTPQHAPAEAFRPRAFFAQFGVADEVTAATAGLIWNPRWDALPVQWNVYFEASLSRWSSRGGYTSDHGVLTQVELIPVFRWRADKGRSAWFGEGGHRSDGHVERVPQLMQTFLDIVQLRRPRRRRVLVRHGEGGRSRAATRTLLQRRHQAPEPRPELRPAAVRQLLQLTNARGLDRTSTLR